MLRLIIEVSSNKALINNNLITINKSKSNLKTQNKL
jgi:hypothetical protein